MIVFFMSKTNKEGNLGTIILFAQFVFCMNERDISKKGSSTNAPV